MASHQRRRSSIDRASINAILTSGEPGQPAAPPSPHVGTSPNRACFAMSPPPRPITNHARALSYNPRKPNRLSLSFPVAPSTNASESARPTPTSSNVPSFPPTPAEIVPTPSPNDPSGFLVALASQERKVLELKEELERAENELKHLKKQWAVHESHKKKAEIRHVEPLVSLSAVATESESGDGTASTRQSAELDRRKALLSNLNIPKESRRKFSGAHTRTLSLLSPERANFKEPRPFSPVHESSFEHHGLSKSTTMPDTSQGITRVSSSRANHRHSYQSGMTHGAKQIAEDLKAGMWTFLEDLRQATVGDEAVNGTTTRSAVDAPNATGTPRRSSKGNLLNNGKRGQSPRGSSPRTWDSLTGNNSLLDTANSLWSDADPLTPASKTPLVSKKTRSISLAAPALDDLDDDWSNWDSPTPKSPRWSASTTLSEPDPATPSSHNTEDRNVKIMPNETDTPSKRDDEIQWPALDKLSPGAIKGNLQRTMSTIMKEWEKSITPPPERKEDPLAKAGKEERTDSASNHDDLVLMSR
ncbi:uncharacterized protein LY89DRAFT_584699 [Mollisia scopiformis]|uniref:DUF4048 domain-containing protein n=1 Tax=Mollisia scopiformis TaxID=149040 RepID=A0A194XB71_MOLSC|nr:uncharacterized protein LY89DRAFT_584699 [Mollisia scopiformis]KUJ17389.1 hypothetical protein LY89DRAFT_584699 [Mollisia scopiformis]